MNTFACKKCGKKLANVDLIDAKIEIKCGRCGTFNTEEKRPKKDIENTKSIKTN